MIASGTPPHVARNFEATIVWFDAQPLDLNRDYLVKHTAQTVPVRVENIRHKINVAKFTTEAGLVTESGDGLAMNEIGVVKLLAARPLFFDRYAENRGTGSFILIDRESNATVAAGMIRGAGAASLENPADRLVRLVRGLIPAGVSVDLPEDETEAIAMLREKLQGVIE